ncbi:MAG TPA: hypothetical protein VNO30_34205 [Kofleriaceae bacterium]|nr:hypothetical protein [Kofleriaceae bacterium]
MEYFRPRRPDYDKIRASIADAPDAARAWKMLVERGALPASWLNDPFRRFIHDPGDRFRAELPTRDPARAPVRSWPHTLDECALFAADVAGVTVAEGAATVLVERLAPWGAPPFQRVLWWTLTREQFQHAYTDTRPGVCYALPFAVIALLASLPVDGRVELGTEAENAAAWAKLWRAQAAAGASVPQDSYVAALRGYPFSRLPNPFEPLADIQAAGYATLEWMGGEGEAAGAAVLIMPRG